MITQDILNLTEIIKAKKKSKTLVPAETELLISETLKVYEGWNDPKHYYEIAGLYKRIGKENAIRFLESKLNTNNTFIGYDYMEAFDMLSDLHFAIGNFDKSFVALRSATICLAKTEEVWPGSRHLLWSATIYLKSAKICYEKKEFADYLFFVINYFLFQTADAFTGYPYLNDFNNDNLRKMRMLDIDFELSESLNELDIQNKKKEIVSELLQFAYTELPIKYGLPSEHLTVSFQKFMNDYDLDREEKDALFKIGRQLELKGYTFILNEASNFTNKLLARIGVK